MRRNNYIKRCKCPCNKELESRYKGREKIYYNGTECRKVWKKMSPEAQKARLLEIEKDIKLWNYNWKIFEKGDSILDLDIIIILNVSRQ